MVRRRGVPLWVWWIVVVWVISFPWIGFTPQPQWARVHAIPFTDPADRPRDMLANIALFIPFGYWFTRERRWWTAALAAAAVSLSAEGTQLFGTLRYPSATDVTAAVLGATAGALWRTKRTDSQRRNEGNGDERRIL
jgi:glycopeptide antibiotics resistance protein